MPLILISGISGQTGSYLAEEMVSAGWEVHGISNAVSPKQLPTNSEIHVFDIKDSIQLQKLVLELEPDAVVNLAAISSVSESWKFPVLTSQTNVIPVAALLDAVSTIHERRKKPIRFIQASSSEIFGANAENPISETSAINPTNPYGSSKAGAHLLTSSYRQSGIHAANAILFNHESPRRPETFVTRKITKAAAKISLGLQQTLTLGDISIQRDWGWAPDYSHALRLMLEDGSPHDYVISTGISHSIKEFVEIAFETVGISNWEKFVSSDESLIRKTENPAVVGNSEKILASLGWQPTINFEQIVKNMTISDLEQIKSSHLTS